MNKATCESKTANFDAAYRNRCERYAGEICPYYCTRNVSVNAENLCKFETLGNMNARARPCNTSLCGALMTLASFGLLRSRMYTPLLMCP